MNPMKIRILLKLSLIILFFQCKSIDNHKNEIVDHKDKLAEDDFQHKVKNYNSSNEHDHVPTEVLSTSDHQKDPYEEFRSKKSAIDIEKLIKNKMAKSSIDQGAFSMGEQLILFSFLA
jgi:hypothetical protein